MKELERFLNRIVLQPKFLQNKYFLAFLQASDSEFSEVKQEKTVRIEPFNFFSIMSKKITNVQAAISNPIEVDEWFSEQLKYWKSNHANFFSLQSCSASISKVDIEIAQLWAEISNISINISLNESNFDYDLAQNFKKFSETTSQLYSIQNDFVKTQVDFFNDVIKDWTRYTNCIFETLSNRQQYLAFYQMAIKNREAKLDKLNKNSGSADIQSELNDAEAQENTSHNKFEIISKSIKSELEKLEKSKSKEISISIRRLVQNSINFHLNASSLWKDTIASISYE